LADCPQWHGGVRDYAVWLLPITEPRWCAFIERAQQQLRPWLHPGYQRQPHITVYAAGLVSEAHYSTAKAQLQLQQLQAKPPEAVTLQASVLSSFATAPWLGVANNTALTELRQQLSQSFDEDSPPPRYQPHITFGFYRGQYASHCIRQQLETLAEAAAELPALTVHELHLCHYRTTQVQGRLSSKQRITLSGNTHKA
jgi:2'-5' RNA ligase